jgi:hypothetical protein
MSGYNDSMATFNWGKIRDQEFTLDEAREASDFEEVMANFQLEPDESFDLLNDEQLSVGKRLYLAEKVSIDKMPAMLFEDNDPRIREVLKARMEAERLEATGGIIVTG